MSPGPHSAKAMPGILQNLIRVGQRILILQLDAEQKFAIRIERPRVGLIQIFVGRNAPDLSRGGHAVDAAPSFVNPLIHALLVDRKSHGFDEGPDRGRRVRMAQQYAVHAGREHLGEHPRIGADRRLVDSRHRHIDDHGRRAMTALRRTALRQAAHVFRQSLYVERGMLHVVADVVGEGLRVTLALFKRAGGPGMRPGVINRLALREKFDRPIDSFRLRLLCQPECRNQGQIRHRQAKIVTRVVFFMQFLPLRWRCRPACSDCTPTVPGCALSACVRYSNDDMFCERRGRFNMARHRYIAVAATFVLMFAASLRGEVKVLKNFTLIDGTGRPPAASSAMIVDNGRVTWVGPSAQLKPPAGAETVDLTGKFVMPGIINLHGHVGNTVDLQQDAKFYTRDNVQKNLATYASYGVTTVLSLGTDQDLIFKIRAGAARRPARRCANLHCRTGFCISRAGTAAWKASLPESPPRRKRTRLSTLRRRKASTSSSSGWTIIWAPRRRCRTR